MNNNIKPANEWGSYWTNESAAGEVFVGKDGNTHPGIVAFWRQAFEQLPAQLKIIDLASGAGSVFQHLPKDHGAQLFAADISDEALELMKTRIPKVITNTCSADALPYQDAEFGMVVSQFGIEYAGDDAFTEAVRVLAPDGQLKMLCHIHDGHIDARNQKHLQHAQTIVSSNFILLARDLIQAIASDDQARISVASADFQTAEQQLGAACRDLPEGIHLHLYQGFRQLFEQREQYADEDIFNWLHTMQSDVERNISRLEHMCDAASTQTDIEAHCSRMHEAGCSEVSFEPFMLEGYDQPLAWAISANK